VELGEVASLNPRTFGQDLQPESEVAFIPMASVEAESGLIDTSQRKTLSEVTGKSLTRFAEGDVLFAKITPCMENGKFAVAKGLKNASGIGSTEFHVIRCTQALDQTYLLHFLLQRATRQRAQAVMSGAVGQLRVPVAFL